MRGFWSLLITFSLLGLIPAQTLAQTFPSPQLDSPQKVARAAYFHKILVDAYETVGSRNPKWDADARAVLQLAVQGWLTPQPDSDVDQQTVVLGNRALRAGCDDPAVLYALFRADARLGMGIPNVALKRLDRKVFDCKYSPFLKVFALGRLMNVATLEGKKHLMQGFYSTLPDALIDSNVGQADIAQLCADVSDVGKELDRDRQPMITKIHDIMAKALPDSAIPDLYLGLVYWLYSWDAPGVGGPEVPGSRTDRHILAREAFASALKKDPNLAAAAGAMVGTMVDAGAIGPELDIYYQLAIKIDPDCYVAYRYKIGSLNTGEPGAVTDLLRFGRTCLESKRWQARIPFLMLRAHRSIAGDNRAEFYRQVPEAWQDVQHLYEGYFAYNPRAITERINYAKLALQTDHPDIARAQLNALKPLTTDPVLKEIIATQSKDVAAELRHFDAATQPVP